MKFKVLNAHKKNGVLLVTGCYLAEPNEKELLEELRLVLYDINRTIDDKVQCNRFVSNDKTILMKSVPIGTVYMVLNLQNRAFNLHMQVVMGRNMQNNYLRAEVMQYFKVHSF